MHQGGGGAEANLEALLAGGRAKGDDVLMALDIGTAGKLQHQGLVEAWHGLEVEGVEAFDDGEACGLDAALDQPLLAVDQLEFGEALEVAHVIDALGGTAARLFFVLA